jgi:hypothetical protein
MGKLCSLMVKIIVNLNFLYKFSLSTCKITFQFGHEKIRLGRALLGGFSTGMAPDAIIAKQNSLKIITTPKYISKITAYHFRNIFND